MDSGRGKDRDPAVLRDAPDGSHFKQYPRAQSQRAVTGAKMGSAEAAAENPMIQSARGRQRPTRTPDNG
jgi:hypothetical protein